MKSMRSVIHSSIHTSTKPYSLKHLQKTPLCGVISALFLSVYVSSNACAQQAAGENSIERVTIQGERPTSLPKEIPTTIESITAKEIEKNVNAIDAEDALKYLPSLLVRKRYVGDYNHAVLATRASGTGNSARSMVYADGVLLSNLLGNGATYTPRWGLVTPEEIERVDVLYGPFSAAYSGNSVGAVVDYITKMPKKLEANAKLMMVHENFDAKGHESPYTGKQVSLNLGNTIGDWSWWMNINRLDSQGHPIVFVNKLMSAGVNSTQGTPVTGYVLDTNPMNKDWVLLGASGQYHTIQDHAKFKLAWQPSPQIKLYYLGAIWKNHMESGVDSYLRDAQNQIIYVGDVQIAGKKFTLTPSDFSINANELLHTTHALNAKYQISEHMGLDAAFSQYRYDKDIARNSTTALPNAYQGGLGKITDSQGTGWQTLSVKWNYQPETAHQFEIGGQRENYQLHNKVSDINNWLTDNAAQLSNAFDGKSQLQSFYAQHAWRPNQDWKTIIGLRYENWKAYEGKTTTKINNALKTLSYDAREENHLSPKIAAAYRWNDDLHLKFSLGKAVRMPTVTELFQGSISNNTIVNYDPLLKPEQSWTNELSAEHNLHQGKGLLRLTYFQENTHDALYSQTNVLVQPNITNIQNIDAIKTQGLEIAYQATDRWISGFDIASSLTYAHSIMTKNDKFPESVGKYQPRVPQWRANLLLSYRLNQDVNTSLGVRYSGKQFGTLNNTDNHGYTYTGFSPFTVMDMRITYKFDSHWQSALGIDNINNKKYWAFHPYSQRSFFAELKYTH